MLFDKNDQMVIALEQMQVDCAKQSGFSKSEFHNLYTEFQIEVRGNISGKERHPESFIYINRLIHSYYELGKRIENRSTGLSWGAPGQKGKKNRPQTSFF